MCSEYITMNTARFTVDAEKGYFPEETCTLLLNVYASCCGCGGIRALSDGVSDDVGDLGSGSPERDFFVPGLQPQQPPTLPSTLQPPPLMHLSAECLHKKIELTGDAPRRIEDANVTTCETSCVRESTCHFLLTSIGQHAARSACWLYPISYNHAVNRASGVQMAANIVPCSSHDAKWQVRTRHSSSSSTGGTPGAYDDLTYDEPPPLGNTADDDELVASPPSPSPPSPRRPRLPPLPPLVVFGEGETPDTAPGADDGVASEPLDPSVLDGVPPEPEASNGADADGQNASPSPAAEELAGSDVAESDAGTPPSPPAHGRGKGGGTGARDGARGKGKGGGGGGGTGAGEELEPATTPSTQLLEAARSCGDLCRSADAVALRLSETACSRMSDVIGRDVCGSLDGLVVGAMPMLAQPEWAPNGVMPLSNGSGRKSRKGVELPEDGGYSVSFGSADGEEGGGGGDGFLGGGEGTWATWGGGGEPDFISANSGAPTWGGLEMVDILVDDAPPVCAGPASQVCSYEEVGDPNECSSDDFEVHFEESRGLGAAARPSGTKPFGSKPFGSKPFGSKAFGSKAFGAHSPRSSIMSERGRSTAMKAGSDEKNSLLTELVE
eukprot:jgi/Chrpa1/5323/Chrysochromulina_OHIO_Genome00015238-RA